MKLVYAFILVFFTTITFNAQENQALFDFLHSGKLTTKNKTVKLPIEIWNDLILIKIKIQGNENTFIWDNGFSVTGIDQSLIEPYKIENFNSKVTVTDGNNKKVSASQFICPVFEIGSIKIENTPMISVDIENILKTMSKKVTGLIGASVINKLNWKFNFDENYVEISDTPFIPKNEIALPYKIINYNLHIMPITLNNYPLETMVDFGYNSDEIAINIGALEIFPNAKVMKQYGQKSLSLSGFNDVDTTYIVKKDYTLALSNKKLDFLPKISFSNSTQKVKLGNKIFRNKYNIIINTTKNTNYFLLPRTTKDAQIPDASYGIKVLQKDNKMYVAQMSMNPNIIDKKVNLMDEVLEFNGKKLKDFKDNFELIKYQKELLIKQASITVKLKGGIVLNLTPKQDIEYQF